MKKDYVYDYVSKYFQRSFPEYYLIFKGNGIKQAEGRYLYLYKNEILAKYDGDRIVSGVYDNEIKNRLERYVNEYYTPSERKDIHLLYRYIGGYLVSKNMRKSNNEIYDHMVKLCVSRLFPQFDESRLRTMEFNNLIEVTYLNIYEQYKNKISVRVGKLLDYNVDVFELRRLGISFEKLKMEITNYILYSEDRVFIERLGKSTLLDSDIELRIDKELNEYIDKYINKIKENNEDKLDNKKVENKNVNSSKKDLSKFKDFSVDNGNSPKRIPYNVKNKKISTRIISLVLVGTIVSGGFAIKRQIEINNDNEAMHNVNVLNGVDYNRLPYESDDVYLKRLASNILIAYSKNLVINNEDYKLRGFYEAYSAIDNGNYLSNLSKMEDIFSMLRDNININRLETGLRDHVRGHMHGTNVNNLFTFLDFAYQRLYIRGMEEVKSDEYQEALEKYKQSKFNNIYGIPYEGLSSEHEKIIQDVVEKYLELSKEDRLDLGYMLCDDEYRAIYNNNSGKGSK